MTFKVSAAHLKSGPKSCVCGAVSQVHVHTAKPSSRVYVSLGYRDGRRVEGDRLDAKIAVPTKDPE